MSSARQALTIVGLFVGKAFGPIGSIVAPTIGGELGAPLLPGDPQQNRALPAAVGPRAADAATAV